MRLRLGTTTKIQWTDHTFNPWRGCTKVSPGCANCYAERGSRRNPAVFGVWGNEGTRVLASDAMWREPFKWDEIAREAAERRRVFCASVADVFEEWSGLLTTVSGRETLYTIDRVRDRLWWTIRETHHLDWLLLTKRADRIPGSLPPDWKDGYPNVWLGVSCEDAKHGFPRINYLRTVPAAVRFVSAEPLLEDISGIDLTGIDWLIVGGESGPKARPFHVEWAEALIDRCHAAGVACFVKQIGTNPRYCGLPLCHEDPKGSDPDEWPSWLRVRQFPVEK